MLNQEIQDSPFHLSYLTYDPSNYDDVLRDKINVLVGKISQFETIRQQFSNINLDVIRSPVSHYRQRCRFAVRNLKSSDVRNVDEISLVMWEKGARDIVVRNFPIASRVIYGVIPLLLELLNESSNLKRGLSAIHFHSTTTLQLLICLIYSTPIEETWLLQASELRDTIIFKCASEISSLSIIGRSKGVKIVIGSDILFEEFHIGNKVLKYFQVEDGFSNPNAAVNMQCLQWICASIQYISNSISNNEKTNFMGIKRKDVDVTDVTDGIAITNAPTCVSVSCVENKKFDLLELYCGNGNHTVAIAGDSIDTLYFYSICNACVS